MKSFNIDLQPQGHTVAIRLDGELWRPELLDAIVSEVEKTVLFYEAMK